MRAYLLLILAAVAHGACVPNTSPAPSATGASDSPSGTSVAWTGPSVSSSVSPDSSSDSSSDPSSDPSSVPSSVPSPSSVAKVELQGSSGVRLGAPVVAAAVAGALAWMV